MFLNATERTSLNLNLDHEDIRGWFRSVKKLVNLVYNIVNASGSESLEAEFNDRVLGALNVIVYGLLESSSPDVEMRKSFNLKFVTRLFESS